MLPRFYRFTRGGKLLITLGVVKERETSIPFANDMKRDLKLDFY